MTLHTLPQDEPWMTPEERKLSRELTRALTEFLTTRGAPDTPITTLRVNEIAITWLLARRLESVLAPTEDDPAPCPTPAQAGAIDKCRERLRKAIKELEDCCTQTAPPKAQGLADQMQETIQKIQAAGFPIDGSPRTDTPIQQDAPPTPETADHPAPPTAEPGTKRNTTGHSSPSVRTAPVCRNTPRPLPPEALAVPHVRPGQPVPLITPPIRDTG